MNTFTSTHQGAAKRLLAVLIAMVSTTATLHAETLHERLLEKAPQIIEHLNERGLKNVGVLKFRIQKPGEKTSDNVGPINSLLADRLEVALILANPFDKARELQIIKSASDQVDRLPDATHLTAEGRRKFFGQKYQPAWGKDLLEADAFLTGIAQIDEDRKSATVGILCFDRNGSGLERIGEAFTAQLDVASAGEMGESFVLRGAFDDGQTSLTNGSQSESERQLREQRILDEASRVKSQLAVFPLSDTTAPVKLDVMYDGKPAPVEFRNGQAFVPEPTQKQKVEFVLTRAPFVKGTLGVVLKVNGENTLYRQTLRDLECSRWLLTPEHTRTVIKGYQMPNSNVAEAFTVLSAVESAKRAVDYGRNVGQIQITVFREQTNVEPETTFSDTEEDLLALLRGIQPEETPQNLDALKAQLRTASKSREVTRGGLITPGDATKNEIEIKEFTPDPIPIMSATITYYSP